MESNEKTFGGLKLSGFLMLFYAFYLTGLVCLVIHPEYLVGIPIGNIGAC